MKLIFFINDGVKERCKEKLLLRHFMIAVVVDIYRRNKIIEIDRKYASAFEIA